ncbi:hypothetical protein B0H14DRAFT_2796941 [Mycena olivaceomarginata]|nr:hypothetical protein B0H14DRAFT_2796941 [Mycena olivaceomarginata]
MSRARSNGRRLSALFDTPSFPLGPPTDGNSGTSPTGSPSSGRPASDPVTPSNRPGSSSPYASPAALSSRHHRRTSSGAAEDFAQVGVLAARKLKLKPESVMRLEDFAKTAASGSEVTMFAQLLKLTEMQALLSPAAGTFVIPKKLDNKIDVHNMRTMLSPTLTFYVKKAGGDSPSGIMKTLVQDHASAWGLTPEVLEDKAQWGVVSSRVRTRLTDRRYEMKKVLVDGTWAVVKGEDGETILSDLDDPMDIITLCEALIAIVPDAGLKVTLPMLGRVALLRQVLIDISGGSKYWEKVDEQLALLRTKYEDDKKLISKAIAKVLKNDCRSYGNPDLSLFT